MIDTGIRFIDFTPGLESHHYLVLPAIQERILALGMPDEPAFWGWGQFRRSPGDYAEHLSHGFSGIHEFLHASGIAIDNVILCAPCLNDSDAFTKGVRALALPGLDQADPEIVIDHDCVNILAAIDIARMRINAGARNVLILSSEKVEKETRRFKKFSLFSDYSLSLVVSAELDACDYRIVDTLILPDPEPGEDTGSVLGRTLEKSCISQLLGRNRMSVDEIDRFCYIHLYEPMYQMKAKDLGFDMRRMATGRIAELGHSYGADPFIGLLTHLTSDHASNDKTALLCASSRQYVGMMLVHKRNAA
jgi:3-oxoacyl-[acyl-carrier-protein] synthase III